MVFLDLHFLFVSPQSLDAIHWNYLLPFDTVLYMSEIFVLKNIQIHVF